MQVEWSPLSLEIRVRLVNTSLCYRRWGGDTDPTTDSLYVCKFVDTWAHSYWAVKYDSPINNDNLGRPIMPKLRGHGRAKVEQWLAHALVAPPTKFNVGSRHRADKTFFPTGKFIALGDRRHGILTESPISHLRAAFNELAAKRVAKTVRNGLVTREYFVMATFFWFFRYFFDDAVVGLTIFPFFFFQDYL